MILSKMTVQISKDYKQLKFINEADKFKLKLIDDHFGDMTMKVII